MLCEKDENDKFCLNGFFKDENDNKFTIEGIDYRGFNLTKDEKVQGVNSV